MDLETRFNELLVEARKRLSQSASSESPERLSALIRVVQECDDAIRHLRRLEEVGMRIRGELNGGGGSQGETSQIYVQPTSARVPGPPRSRRDGKADAERERQQLLNTLRSEGLNLHREKGKRMYRTDTGKRVGICFANEDKRGDIWWMGIPDEQFDVLVPVCRTVSGDVLVFVLPREFVAQVWPLLSREKRSGQVEFHVRRSGPNFELSDAPGTQLNQYLSAYNLLR